MIIDMNVTIAYKCPACGAFEFFGLSFFKLSKRKEYNFTCRCGKTQISVQQKTFSSYKINMPCIGCGNSHTFILDIKDLSRKDIYTFSCPKTGVQQCFLGTDIEVREKVDRVEEELDELINAFGYDSYFKNTRVMLDTLNKIHDIAEQGNLYCECGNNNLQLVLLPDRVKLVCGKCSRSKVIYAATNKDLKNILQDQYILLLNKEKDEVMSRSDTI